MKKQPEKTAQTRAALVRAFWELYKNKQITQITVREVTEGAGYYRSTFYDYFSDVYAILEQVEGEILQAWNAMWEEAEFVSFDLPIERAAAFYEEYGDRISILLSPDGDPAFMPKLKLTAQQKIFALLNIKEQDVETELIFAFVFSGLLALLTSWYRNGKSLPTHDVIHLARALLTEGALRPLLLHARTVPDIFAALQAETAAGSEYK